MGVDKIDIFMPPKGKRNYGLIVHFTKKLFEALQRAGKKTRLLEFERTNPRPFLSMMFSDPPEFTLSFNGILPDEKGTFLSDLIKIPHVAYLLDSFHYFYPLINSPRSIIACHDEISVNFIKNLQFDRAFFLPYGVERELVEKPLSNLERPIDILFIARALDPEKILSKWNANFSEKWVQILKDTSRSFLLLSDTLSLYENLMILVENTGERIESFDGIALAEMMIDMEIYSRGIERIEVLKALQGRKVDLFTPKKDRPIWARLLGDAASSIEFHEPVTYDKSYLVMRQAKIILNSTPALKTGVSERVLSGIGCGGRIFSNYSSYISEFLNERDGFSMYSLADLEDFRAKIERFLTSKNSSWEAVENGRKKILEGHTWDVRVEDLCRHLDALV